MQRKGNLSTVSRFVYQKKQVKISINALGQFEIKAFNTAYCAVQLWVKKIGEIGKINKIRTLF